MNKSIGILLMVVLGVSGVVVTALAWLYPSLNLNKIEATLAGLIGMGFTIFQSIRFRYLSRIQAEPAPIEVEIEEKA